MSTDKIPEDTHCAAVGVRLERENAGGSFAMWHNRPNRKAQPVGDDIIGGKWRWVG